MPERLRASAAAGQSAANQGSSSAIAPASTAHPSSDEPRDWTITTAAATAMNSSRAITKTSTMDTRTQRRGA